ncbi:hypothetical protein GCM10011273_17210 [Asticcacaulis endophyticus]|uniref:Uncharacterized protein n=1 Tax=Asticcacaulis endophyticus TaxID=1395890 RepID=A0A918Q2F6_9CAUL|nr:hypothetical protein GCM10011273_17210 [Asticcacaulis endophyticus]
MRTLCLYHAATTHMSAVAWWMLWSAPPEPDQNSIDCKPSLTGGKPICFLETSYETRNYCGSLLMEHGAVGAGAYARHRDR